MTLSEAAKAILSACWVKEEPRGTTFIIGENYKVNGKSIKTSEHTYEELISFQEVSDKPYKVSRVGKSVNVMGRRLINE